MRLALLIVAVIVAFAVVIELSPPDRVVEAAPPVARPVPARAVRTVPTAGRSRRVVPRPRRTPLRSHETAPSCTASNWRSTLSPVERWIDWHESRLDPTAVEPTTGAFGLGQLLPSTYVALGLPMSANPCSEIAAQRAYMRERYGNWRNAKTHWLEVSWW